LIESESDTSPENSTSSNKKRKPGRPRKCNPTPGGTGMYTLTGTLYMLIVPVCKHEPVCIS